MILEKISYTIDYALLLKFLFILGIGILIAVLVKILIKKFSARLIYPQIRKSSIKSYRRTQSMINLTSSIIQWFIIFIFLMEAVSVFEISLMNQLIIRIGNFLPNLIVAFVIIIIGIIISNAISKKILDLDFNKSKLVAKIFEIFFISAVILSSLEVIGIELGPFRDIFRAGIYAFTISFALAIGIGLGLALKPEFEKVIEMVKKKN